MVHALACREWAEVSSDCARILTLGHPRHLPCLQAMPNLESLALIPKLRDSEGYPWSFEVSEVVDALSNLRGLQSLQSLHWEHCEGLSRAVLALVPRLKVFKIGAEDGYFGRLPDAITQLKNLEELDYRCLDEPSLTELPHDVGDLTSLRRLYLLGCALESLPKSFQELPCLQVLHLEFRRTQDEDLQEQVEDFEDLELIFRLTCLEELRLSLPKRYEGDEEREYSLIPDSLGNLANLRKLHLEGSDFLVPDSVALLTNLKSLTIHSDDDSHPDISSLTGLRHLDLESDNVVEVPTSLSRLTSLTSLRLSGNSTISLTSLARSQSSRL